jgi:bla regulator protein BlaR1
MDALPLLLASARVIGWALVHFVWQGALLGGVYAIARMALPRGEARYCFGMGVLVLLALCPLLTVWRPRCLPG